ncbi:MAG: low molecular weight protein-tyrosine-phosphatase [Capnocytophaga sp.]|nr:low molecular weight protein-tyrosine-phosphatase [Capnocytophaga sp.]
MEKTNILMVCLGNICRSPLAEGVLKSMLDSQKFMVDSAGTASYHTGDTPDRRSVEVARENGVDISNLKARTFSVNDFEKFDYIFVMDKSNYKNVIQLAKNEQYKAKVSFLLDELETQNQKELPDPYYGDKSDFEKVYRDIAKACKAIAEKLSN